MAVVKILFLHTYMISQHKRKQLLSGAANWLRNYYGTYFTYFQWIIWCQVFFHFLLI